MITTIIFDMDDTLYDEVDYCRSGFRAVAGFLAKVPNLKESHGAGEIFDAFLGEFEAGNYGQTFNSALDKLGISYDSEMIGHLIGVYREHIPDIKLPAESREIIDMLFPAYRLALLTDGFLPAQRLKVEALGIGGDFECIIYTEELGRKFWKPSTKGFKVILKQMGVKAEECVYVGDNASKDFIGPNELGMGTIQLVRTKQIHNSPPGSLGAAAGQIIGEIGQLPHAIERL